MFPILETDRLILREIRQEDAQSIYDCFSNDDVTKYYGQEPIITMDQAEKIIQFFSNSYKEKRGIRWGIQIKGQDGLVGTVGFNNWVPKHKRAEIGYEILPKHWRKGYTSEAVLKVISYGFDEMDLTRIGAVVYPENEASNTLLTKIGFEKEGVLRNYMYQNGKTHDTNVYSMLKEFK